MKREMTRVPILLLVSGLLAGCGVLGGDDKGVAATMNMQEAAEHADTMLDSTLGAIEPEVQWAHDDTSTGSCDLTRRRTVMTIISEQRRGNFLGMVERYWKKSGYRITSVNPNKDSPAIFANSPEGFGISLIVGYKGQVFFDVDSPASRSRRSPPPPPSPTVPPTRASRSPVPTCAPASGPPGPPPTLREPGAPFLRITLMTPLSAFVGVHRRFRGGSCVRKDHPVRRRGRHRRSGPRGGRQPPHKRHRRTGPGRTGPRHHRSRPITSGTGPTGRDQRVTRTTFRVGRFIPGMHVHRAAATLVG